MCFVFFNFPNAINIVTLLAEHIVLQKMENFRYGFFALGVVNECCAGSECLRKTVDINRVPIVVVIFHTAIRTNKIINKKGQTFLYCMLIKCVSGCINKML